MTDAELQAIRMRHEDAAAISSYADDDLRLVAWEESARDVPALLEEVAKARADLHAYTATRPRETLIEYWKADAASLREALVGLIRFGGEDREPCWCEVDMSGDEHGEGCQRARTATAAPAEE